MKTMWIYGLILAAIKFAYNLAYFIIKYTEELDGLYLGLMIANLLVLITNAICSRWYPIACKLLGYVVIIGLFIENF